jgi:hypothetical protein
LLLLIRPPHRERGTPLRIEEWQTSRLAGTLIIGGETQRTITEDAGWTSALKRDEIGLNRHLALGNPTWATRLCRRQLQLVRHARQVRQGRCPHLAHDLATMDFYRDFAYAEVACDLLV